VKLLTNKQEIDHRSRLAEILPPSQLLIYFSL